jgi:hypothetical protein
MHGLRPAFNHADGAWLTTQRAGREAAYADGATTPPSYYVYLDVNDAFLHATPSQVWVTVEYFDGANDRWSLEYDGVGAPYSTTTPVVLENTGQWKRHTFHLTDVYFGGRQNEGADLRLGNFAWDDGQTNYFGRVWISKTVGRSTLPLRPPHHRHRSG